MASSVRSVAGAGKRLPLGLVRLAAGLGLSLSLSACAGSSIGSSFSSFMPGSPPPETAADAKEQNKFLATPTCPGAEIRYGAESIDLYTNNAQPLPDTLRFQINVQRVARECDVVGDNVVARVGAAGRVVAGPKGSASKVDVPVRIVAMNGDKQVYTAMKTVSVEVQAPDFGANWAVVDESVTIPAAIANSTVIYIGLEDKNRPAREAKAKSDATTPAAAPRVVHRRPKPQAQPSAPASGTPDMTPAYIK
jgi:hypothetical protein